MRAVKLDDLLRGLGTDVRGGYVDAASAGLALPLHEDPRADGDLVARPFLFYFSIDAGSATSTTASPSSTSTWLGLEGLESAVATATRFSSSSSASA